MAFLKNILHVLITCNSEHERINDLDSKAILLLFAGMISALVMLEITVVEIVFHGNV